MVGFFHLNNHDTALGADTPADREARVRMVRNQLEVPGRSIRDPRVLDAMRAVPRHWFVPPDVRSLAYEDRPLPIGYDQTISQPYMVAFMTEALELEPRHRVLEIGTGSGYQTAILASLVSEVYSIERITPLGTRAQTTFAAIGMTNIHAKVADGFAGWPEAAPFDRIIVTCAPDAVPSALVDQLVEGGLMIVPVGKAGGVQELVRLEKREGQIHQRDVLSVQFVPMKKGIE